MKVLVDTSVWIDFLRGRPTEQVEKLEALIKQREDICFCGLVLTEVLQGIRDDKQFALTKSFFSDLLYLECDRSTFELSATIYRELRKKGLTIRNSVDCMIAAVVVQSGVHLLENDRDYQQIEQHYPINRI